MTHRPAYFTKILFIATWLAVGCTSSGTLGCGSGDGASAPTVDSELPGIYLVDRFQSSPECGELMDAQAAPRIVLYSALRADSDEPILVGQFCGDVENCRAQADQGSSLVNYSFFEGSDAEGWEGYGIADQGMAGDQCRVEVQVHTLTSPSSQSIRIDTEQVETIYPPSVVDDVGTCTIRDAIESITDDSPCTGLFLLDATFETSL